MSFVCVSRIFIGRVSLSSIILDFWVKDQIKPQEQIYKKAILVGSSSEFDWSMSLFLAPGLMERVLN